jgi:CMP-N-acetylneuraminic acid synthetase
MIIGLIPARGGSKGVPGKNLREVAGRPLIAHSIIRGKECSLLDHVIVSTDSSAIADVAREYNAEVPFVRPDYLANDTAGMLPVMQHAITESESEFGETVELLVLLEPTGPLRTVDDIVSSIRMIGAEDCDAVVSGTETKCNPFYNSVKEVDGYFKIVTDINSIIGRRQDAPEVFDLLPYVWVYRRRALMDEKLRIPRMTCLYRIPRERAIDLDTIEDFRYLEFLLDQGVAKL